MRNGENRGASVMQSAGVVPAVASIDAVAVYDPEDGRIVHMHHAISFEGAAKPRDVDAQCRRALEAARELGRDVSGLEVLHVPGFEPSEKVFEVDLKTRRLVGTRLSRPDLERESDRRD